ncbi:glycosyltransferase family 2 protein [Agreia sp. COWG]|uniref:glycosyltransferase family 2 protein n=1 Tax=Agreia sp. COWG TaxID=2773266 RepID=UPI00192926F7|nr:glycosyltransferase family 2 protein [Agreia sp. COWG]CAD5991255.1 Glycosyltransferase involved in cell wall bisynthesis [Agreia sp. COWG]
MATTSTPSVTVAIASVGRPDDLKECIAALRLQTDTPEEIVVVAQSSDAPTRAVASDAGLRTVVVAEPGLALALETAIRSVSTEVIAFVDDDARAMPDWVSRIRGAYASDPNLGLFGGRDNVDGDRTSGDADLAVGRLTRGKIAGNHHLGKGNFRVAEHVKGANMSMRVAPARRVPLGRLVAGTGAQSRNEFVLSLGVTSQGYGAAYDPRLQVDHFPAKRASGDERTSYTRERILVQRHNEALALSLYSSRSQTVSYVLRALLVGDQKCCGLTVAIIKIVRGEKSVLSKLGGTWTGVISGLRAASRERSRRYEDVSGE